jgi:hypothetical protein
VQAPGELGQCKLQVGMASAEQAPGGHGASSRGEQTSGGCREGPRGSSGGEALTRRPGDTTVAWRGSARTATTASSQGKSLTTSRRITKHQISPWTGPSNLRSSSRSPWPRSRASEVKGMQASGGQSTRSRGQAESLSLDLLIEHHLSGGLRRSLSKSSAAAARRCGRQREHEGEDDVGERRGMTGRADRATWSGSTR